MLSNHRIRHRFEETRPPQVNGFCFSATSTPWNGEPIPSRSAESKITNHFSATSVSLCEITVYDFDMFTSFDIFALDEGSRYASQQKRWRNIAF